jgi:hypothetical protein
MCRVDCYYAGRHLVLRKLCAPVAASPRSLYKQCFCSCIAAIKLAFILASRPIQSLGSWICRVRVGITHLARPFFFALGLRSDAGLASLLCPSPNRSFALFSIFVRGTVAIKQVAWMKGQRGSLPFHSQTFICMLEFFSMRWSRLVRWCSQGSATELVRLETGNGLDDACCTYARLKPLLQSVHLYARSLSSVHM